MKRFRAEAAGYECETTDHRLYLQVNRQGFWDTVDWVPEADFAKQPEMFDKKVAEALANGDRVRIRAIRVEQTEILTEFIKEL